ncbi:biopolymer transport protein ExbD [Marinicella pacifica]|jgi:biopolymer transport protein ExbD|uniref:Biopolymer transport protein ExbD n=1 Tax=Marinicella pacifica TaxID=1171543 RepID=A0A917FL30_9GAMM|nr:biopolymer transporter ExbD [Marinicella pacifica]GGF91591.1 biopolymer transport protein ExbD [Marinicella pacifica]
MKFSTEDNNPSRLNLTSLIDVVFLLLIFFMVSTTFEKQSKLKIELPEATQTDRRTAPQNVTVTINAKGVFYLNDKQLSEQNANGLRQQLSAVIEQDETARVLIKADANAPHKFVVTALDVVGQLGIEGVSIATTETRP